MNRKISTVLATVFLMASSVSVFAQTRVVVVDEPDGIFRREISEKDRCISFESQSPFELNVVADSIWVGLSGAGFLAANLGRIYGKFPEYVPGTIYNKDAVGAFERWAMRPYNKGLDTAGTVVSVVDTVLPVLAYGMEFLFSNLPKKDGGTLAVMYIEALLTSNAIKESLKLGIHRVRPYMYFENFDTSAIKYHDFEFSLPSGHTMNAFIGATFLTYTFCQYYPESNWRIPVIATSYALAIGTGVMRMASGNHFLSDVLAGAAIGSACGFLVPFAHTFIAKANARLASYSEKTGAPKMELAALPMGVSMTVKF